MNESIGNTTMGKPFSYLIRNMQIEGDLARERGGYLLGISYADHFRDKLVETAFYFAGGCRPMAGPAPTRSSIATAPASRPLPSTRRSAGSFDPKPCCSCKPRPENPAVRP